MIKPQFDFNEALEQLQSGKGLPAEAIGLLLVVDRLLDMMRTAVNIFSDSVGAVVIARSEGELDLFKPVTIEAKPENQPQ